MVDVSWQAAADGRYWIDVTIGGQSLRVMIDLGLVDPLQAVGFELDPAIYDGLKRAGKLSRFQYRFRRDANAQITGSESGQVQAQLLDPTTGQLVGPTAVLHVCRGTADVPSRVGVVFFHRLTACNVHWNLDTRNWRIECP